MLCYLGLFAGLAVGRALGEPWTFIAPAVGFGLGLVGDTKVMHGSHGGHGGVGGHCGGGGHVHDEEVEEAVRDPICGMQVNGKTKYRLEFKGKTYRFCSKACMSEFQDDPRSYT